MNSKAAARTFGIVAFVFGVSLVLATASAHAAGVTSAKSTSLVCSLTEAGTSVKRPAIVKFRRDRSGTIVAVNVSIKSGRITLAEITENQIAWRASTTNGMKIQRYQSEPGVQACFIAKAKMTIENGVTVIGKCSILPESGMPPATSAKFELRIAPQAKQDFGNVQAGNRFYVAGYNLNDCR